MVKKSVDTLINAPKTVGLEYKYLNHQNSYKKIH